MSEQLLENNSMESYCIPSIRYRLSEFLVEKTGLIHELRDLKPGDSLPAESDWLRPENASDPIMEYISSELGEKVDTVAKRIYDMKKEKYIDLKKPNDYKQKPIINIRLISRGVEYYVNATEKLRKEEGIIDETDVAELEAMAIRGAEIAKKLGNITLAEYFKNRYEQKSPFELSQEEFKKEMQIISAKLEELDGNNL